jgi:hypothetical protein
VTAEGPILEALMHRLSECPEDFLLDPATISVNALVCDLLRDLSVVAPQCLPDRRDPAAWTLIAIACWLLNDDWLLARPDLAQKVQKLLSSSLLPLASVVQPREFVSDPDRREELARFCLAELGLRPQGESSAQAKDRLAALDSVERVRVLRDTAAAEARAQEVRKMMAKRLAEEAAAKATRE